MLEKNSLRQGLHPRREKRAFLEERKSTTGNREEEKINQFNFTFFFGFLFVLLNCKKKKSMMYAIRNDRKGNVHVSVGGDEIDRFEKIRPEIGRV